MARDVNFIPASESPSLPLAEALHPLPSATTRELLPYFCPICCVGLGVGEHRGWFLLWVVSPLANTETEEKPAEPFLPAPACRSMEQAAPSSWRGGTEGESLAGRFQESSSRRQTNATLGNRDTRRAKRATGCSVEAENCRGAHKSAQCMCGGECIGHVCACP